MGVLILDNRRIFLKRILKYELNSDTLYYRNDTKEERFLFVFLLNEDDLWSKYSFEYLDIELCYGLCYKFYSDKKLNSLLKKMGSFFEENNIHSMEDIDEDDEHLIKAWESYKHIKNTFIFTSKNISSITDKIDNAFGTI